MSEPTKREDEIERALHHLKESIRKFGSRSADAGRHGQKRAIALGEADALAAIARRERERAANIWLKCPGWKDANHCTCAAWAADAILKDEESGDDRPEA